MRTLPCPGLGVAALPLLRQSAAAVFSEWAGYFHAVRVEVERMPVDAEPAIFRDAVLTPFDLGVLGGKMPDLAALEQIENLEPRSGGLEADGLEILRRAHGG